MGELVDVTRDGGIARVVMQRKGNNSIAEDLMQELASAFQELGADPSVRVVVLASAYEKYFSVGADLRSEEHTSELQSPCNLVCRLLLEKKKAICAAALAVSAPKIVYPFVSAIHSVSLPLKPPPRIAPHAPPFTLSRQHRYAARDLTALHSPLPPFPTTSHRHDRT